MIFLNKIREYVYRFIQTLRQDGFKAALKRIISKVFPRSVVNQVSKPVNVQDWLSYYQSRGDEYLDQERDHIPTDTPKVSILILTYNNLQLNQLCLQSLYCNTTYPNFEVIVVDNGSTDETPDWLKLYAVTHSNLKLILNLENRGFAGGNNQAAREATGEYLIFLNNDTVVTQGWVERLMKHLQTTPEIGLVGPVTNAIANEALISVDYISALEMEVFAEKTAIKMKGRSFDIRMLAFYCVMARRSQYMELGGLDERYSVGMFEDDDIAVQYLLKGLRVVCVEDVFIHHFHRSSFGKLEEEVHQKIFDENRKKYEEKWGREWQPYQLRKPAHENTPHLRPVKKHNGILHYRCNICGRACMTPVSELGRERPSCRCGSTVRTRAIVHILSTELFGQSLAIPDFPIRHDLLGWGMSDAGYSDKLPGKLNYINTFYHQEPRLDITAALDPRNEGSLDFLISTEVFEHITPPASIAFENARRLLKRNGVFIFSVPYTLKPQTQEHFPDLYKYELINDHGFNPVLKNITRDGNEQVFNNLVFHGGPGATLEMRVFSQAGLMSELQHAGFGKVKIYSEPCWEFGVYWQDSWSLPMAARI